MPRDAFQQAADDQSIGSLAHLQVSSKESQFDDEESPEQAKTRKKRPHDDEIAMEIQQEEKHVRTYAVAMLLSLVGCHWRQQKDRTALLQTANLTDS